MCSPSVHYQAFSQILLNQKKTMAHVAKGNIFRTAVTGDIGKGGIALPQEKQKEISFP